MKKDIKDYLHLYFPFQFVHEKYPERLMTTHFMSRDGTFCYGRSDEFEYLKPHHKILLRSLSDMTEEEKIELIRVEHPLSTHPILIDVHLMGTTLFFGAKDKKMRHFQTFNIGINGYTANEFVYLLSKYFDLFGLIESNLALDKTKLPTEVK
jgi:hypothetical protein